MPRPRYCMLRRKFVSSSQVTKSAESAGANAMSVTRTMTGTIHCSCFGRALAGSVKPDTPLDDEQRAALDLLVDAADVLAEDADTDQLHAADEKHTVDRGGKAREGLVDREKSDEVVDAQDECCR